MLVCDVLDADAGTLQLLYWEAADMAAVSAVSTNTACWHWQANRCQNQVSGLQIHEDQ